MKWVLNKRFFREEGIESFFNTFSQYYLVIFLLILLLFFFLVPVNVLLATDYKTDKYIKAWKLKEDSFSISYTHSVELTEVIETYTIQGEDIILKESYFKSYGAGLPATTPYRFEITDKGFRIYDIDEIMNNLIYRTGAEKANHRLILGNREYRFLDFSKPRAGIRFQVKKVPLGTYLVKECVRWMTKN